MPFLRTGSQRRAALFICAVLLPATITSGCGKKGPPLPPLRILPERVEGLRIRQIGEKLTLSMPRPTSRDDGSALGQDARLVILMSAQEPVPKSGKEVAVNHALRWSITGDKWDAYAQGSRLDVSLSLDRIAEALGLTSDPANLRGRKLSFIVQVEESRKKRSAPSNLSTLTICDPPPAPAHVAGRLLEAGLLITWDPGGDVKEGKPDAYNVFRHEPGGPRPELPLKPAPSSELSFLDASALYDRPYIYAVRTLSVEAGCESAAGALVAATRKDIFPPLPPEGLAAVAEQGAIRLFWRPSRDEDLKGYRVYRAEGDSGPMERLTPEMLTNTTYTDQNVKAGVMYSYAVTAVDGASPPNESAFSIQAAESLESR